MKLNTKLMASALAFGTLAGGAFAADCGDISISEANWPSAELMANVDKIILEEGYDCSVELVPGNTSTTFASMSEKGQPDVSPEQWTAAITVPLNRAKEEGSLLALNPGPITGLGEGWWVTEAFVKAHPELDTVEKVIEHPELFPDAEDPSKGAFMGCPAGWGCQAVNANLFRAFDMEEKGWVLIDPGSAAGLDGAIAKAAEREENWLGYYWNPTAIVGKYHLTMLPFEAEWGGAENWDTCISLDPVDCADPQPTSWVASAVETIVTDDFVAKAGPAADYFKARVFPGEVMNEMLVYMVDNQSMGEDAAYRFFDEYEDIWTQWVPADVAEKVKSAL